MFKKFLAVAAATMLAGAAHAATLTGTFGVTAVNVTNLNGTESQATYGNFTSAMSCDYDAGSVCTYDAFTYVGALDFSITTGQTASTTIGQWLDSSGGTTSYLDSSFANLQLSYPDIGNGTATTTFFFFTAVFGAGDYSINHDDGVGLFYFGDLGPELAGGTVGPTTLTNTSFTSLFSGEGGLLYVATNGNPSVLNVDYTAAVPLPAGLPLLLLAVGGLAVLRRRSAA